MASRSIYAPVIAAYQPAFTVSPGGDNECVIKFALSKFNGSRDFTNVQATVRKQDSGISVIKQEGLGLTGILLDIPCDKSKDDDGYYSISLSDDVIKTMSSDTDYPGWVPGYTYKVQIRLSNASYTDYVSELENELVTYNANVALLQAARDTDFAEGQADLLGLTNFYRDTVWNIYFNTYDVTYDSSNVYTTATACKNVYDLVVAALEEEVSSLNIDSSTIDTNLSSIKSIYEQNITYFNLILDTKTTKTADELILCNAAIKEVSEAIVEKIALIKQEISLAIINEAISLSTYTVNARRYLLNAKKNYVADNPEQYANLISLATGYNDKIDDFESCQSTLLSNDYTKNKFTREKIKRLFVFNTTDNQAITTIHSLISNLSLMEDYETIINNSTEAIQIAEKTAKYNALKTTVDNQISSLISLESTLASTYLTNEHTIFLNNYYGSSVITSAENTKVNSYISNAIDYCTNSSTTITESSLASQFNSILADFYNDAGGSDTTFYYKELYSLMKIYSSVYITGWCNNTSDTTLKTQLASYYTEILNIYTKVGDDKVYNLDFFNSIVAELIAKNRTNSNYISSIITTETASDSSSSTFLAAVEEYLAAVDFTTPAAPTQLNQYEWIQENSDNFSEWSTVCAIKATGLMRLQVPTYNQYDSYITVDDDNEDTELYVDNLNFNGIFSSIVDASESLYTYKVDIYGYDDAGSLVLWDSSGNLPSPAITDSDNNLLNEQPVRYNTKVVLPTNKAYQIVFSYVTTNYNEGSWTFDVFYNSSLTDSLEIRVMTVDYIDSNQYNDEVFDGEDKATYPYHSGIHEGEGNYYTLTDSSTGTTTRQVFYAPPYIMRSITSVEDEEAEGRIALCLYTNNNESLSTNVIVKRASSKDCYSTWEEIKIFNFIDEAINPTSKADALSKVFYDYTIESGVYYKYCTETEDEYGNRTALYEPSNHMPVVRYFESAYLLGQNEQQLNIKFNNSMSSMKVNVSDTKTDTLGSKYPYVVRNGSLKYKTFPVEGLISLLSDEQELFAGPSSLYGNGTTSYTQVINALETDQGEYGTNQYAWQFERDFRDAVMNFLTDGKVKLFKSLTEGNVLVRLTDVTFSPQQTLGRLLYSFSATATEIAEYNYDNCLKYNLTQLGECIKDFEKSEYRIGQLSGTYATKGFVDSNGYISEGDNLIDLIYEKYNFKGQNIAGHLYAASDIIGMRIEIHHKPLRTPDGLRGFVIKYNDTDLYVTSSMNGIYEFDTNIRLTNSDSIYIMADSELLPADNILNEVDLTVDFIFELNISKQKAKQIKTSTQKRGLGQLHEYFNPGDSLFVPIYNKYYFESDYAIGNGEPQFRRLNNIYGIRIEANPGSIFNIEPDDGDLTKLEVGMTGVLNFYDLVDIAKINYVGRRRDEERYEKQLNYYSEEIENLKTYLNNMYSYSYDTVDSSGNPIVVTVKFTYDVLSYAIVHNDDYTKIIERQEQIYQEALEAYRNASYKTADNTAARDNAIDAYNKFYTDLNNYSEVLSSYTAVKNSSIVDQTIGTDVILDYYFYTKFGEYLEED